MTMRYRVYRIGGTEHDRFEDREVCEIVYEGGDAPGDATLDALYEKYGQGFMLPIVEPTDSEMPKLVRDLLGSPAERNCPKHGRHIGAACPKCALDEMVEISEQAGLYDDGANSPGGC